MPWAKIEHPIMLDFPPGKLCSSEYPNHKHGCPNYGKRPTCPPQASIINEQFPGQWWAIWNKFEFFNHTERMRKAHPKWTDRQVANCLYWQGRARKCLKIELGRFRTIERLMTEPDAEFETVPEARGVNVTETMKLVGIDLEWPPKYFTYQVGLIFVIGDSICALPTKNIQPSCSR